MKSSSRRIPGARWFFAQARLARNAAALKHGRSLADLYHEVPTADETLSRTVPATQPEYGSTGRLSSGSTAPSGPSLTR